MRIDVSGHPVFVGGFLGVDVFFVISGFLIGSIVFSELRDEDGFSWARFYERRVRRILPALFFVMALCVIPAALLLTPSELERFARSLVASTFFVSNHFWEIELSEYGAQSSLYEPFVHTWSLAVEEQFYLLYPLAALAIWRYARRPPVVIGALILFGLVAAQAATLVAPAKSFFWLPSRIWELLAGVLMAWGATHGAQTFRDWRMARRAPTLGLALIVASVLVVDIETMAHPGFVTLPAVAGACMIIWFATPGDPTTRLLSSRPFVAVGLVSYSLYLWHYPVFAFGRRVSMIPTGLDMAIWVAVSVAMAALTYRFVERPFRDRSVTSRPLVIRGALGGAVAVAGLAVVVLANDGFAGRFGGVASIYKGDDADNGRLARLTWGPLNEMAGYDTIVLTNNGEPSENEAKRLWFKDRASTKVLIVGNSHSNDFFNAVHLNRGLFPGYEFARFGMGQEVPEAQVETLVASPNFRAADEIVIAHRYEVESMDDMERLVRAIRAAKGDVVMLGNTVEFPMIGTLSLFDWYARSHPDHFDPAELEAIAYENRVPRVPEVNAMVAALAAELGARYLPKSAYMCDDAAKTCNVVGGADRKLIYDYGHYTIEGAREYGRRMHELGWFGPRTGAAAPGAAARFALR